MKKLIYIILSIVLLLTACDNNDPKGLTLDEVLLSLEEQQLSLIEAKINRNDIFGKKLHGVRPSVYELDAKHLFIYIYDSAEAREKGLEDFQNKTELMNIVSFNTYEVENVLVFYVHGQDLSMNDENDHSIREAMNSLSRKGKPSQ